MAYYQFFVVADYFLGGFFHHVVGQISRITPSLVDQQHSTGKPSLGGMGAPSNAPGGIQGGNVGLMTQLRKAPNYSSPTKFTTAHGEEISFSGVMLRHVMQMEGQKVIATGDGGPPQTQHRPVRFPGDVSVIINLGLLDRQLNDNIFRHF